VQIESVHDKHALCVPLTSDIFIPRGHHTNARAVKTTSKLTTQYLANKKRLHANLPITTPGFNFYIRFSHDEVLHLYRTPLQFVDADDADDDPNRTTPIENEGEPPGHGG